MTSLDNLIGKRVHADLAQPGRIKASTDSVVSLTVYEITGRVIAVESGFVTFNLDHIWIEKERKHCAHESLYLHPIKSLGSIQILES